MANAAKKRGNIVSLFDKEVAEFSRRYLIDESMDMHSMINDSNSLNSRPPSLSMSNNDDAHVSLNNDAINESATHSYNNRGFRPELKALKTLIVEDNPTDRLVIENAAEILELDFTVAENGEQAIKALAEADAKAPFSLVIIDYKMPELDGLTASRYIKDELRLKNPPKIILLSAFRRDEIFNQPNSFNCVNAFLTKPISPNSLHNALEDIIDHALECEEVWPAPKHKENNLTASNENSLSVEEINTLLSKCHILLAEDNPINQRVAMGILKLKGVRVTIANNGQEALDIVAKSPANEFDAILMDIDMPILDGYQATTSIKRKSDWSNVPIIALTAHNTPEDKEKCLGIGMSDYLTKPIKPEKLYESIANHVNNTD